MQLKKLLSFLLLLMSTQMMGCKLYELGWGYNQNYSPVQPIPFDHSVHAGANQIQCQYCHSQVEKSRHANIPAPGTCMNCHLTVAGDKPGVQKLQEAFGKGESIEWVKVHMLPDHVQFNHSAHVTKGVSCQTCHGPVETMKQVYQFSNLSMGWCIDCHRKPEVKAPTNCSTCHQ